MDKPNVYEDDGNRKAYRALLDRNAWGKDPNMGRDGPNIRIRPIMIDLIRDVGKLHEEALQASVADLAKFVTIHNQVLNGEYD